MIISPVIILIMAIAGYWNYKNKDWKWFAIDIIILLMSIMNLSNSIQKGTWY